MNDSDRRLLIAIAEGLASRLRNAGGTGFQYHSDNLMEAAVTVQHEMEYEPVDDGRGG